MRYYTPARPLLADAIIIVKTVLRTYSMHKTLTDFVREARQKIKETPLGPAHEQIEKGDVLVIDVREPDEYSKGHIPGAINIPRGTLEGAADPSYKHRVPALCDARDREILLYCQSGGRSAMAAATLQEMGFTRVRSLAGGWEVWEGDDLPIESQPA